MGFIDRLVAIANSSVKVERVVVGIRYTAVQLEDGSLGLSYTEEAGGISPELPGRLAGKKVDELISLIKSPRGVESSIGLASINAVINRNVKGEKADAMEFVEVSSGDVVAMVGFFPGYAEMLRNKGAKVKILEIREMGETMFGVELYPWWASEQIISNADLIIITAATIVNKTIESLLSIPSRAKAKVLVGPSSPLEPALLRECGVTVAGGVKVVEPELALKIIEEGGGTKELLRYNAVEKVTIAPR